MDMSCLRMTWTSAPCWHLTSVNGPSVVQVRAHDVLPEHLEEVVVATIREYEPQLQQGAIVTVDESRGKVRMLPIGPTKG